VIPGFLIGPVIGAAIAAAVYGWVVLVHNPGVRAELQAEISAAVTTERLRLEQLASAALAAQAAESAEREAGRVVTRERIIRVPVTTACAGSPAVRHAVDSLRQPPAGPGAPSGAGVAAGVPGAAAAP
jgi:hypothetical protein